MTFRCPSFGRVFATIYLLTLGLAFPGCSKRGEVVVMESSMFDSAPAELRDKWKAAEGFVSKDNYLGAATNLMDVFSKSQGLTPEQHNALTQALQRLGNRAFDAANKGDKAATEAVLKMRASGIGDQTGR